MDFALDCIKISFELKILLQITYFAEIAQPGTLLWGWGRGWVATSLILRRELWLPPPPYFELVDEKMNQLFTITRACLWESHPKKWCIFTHHLLIERKYIMFTLPILNKSLVMSTIQEKTVDMRFRDSGFRFRLPKKFPSN